jgi:hypothetical protein
MYDIVLVLKNIERCRGKDEKMVLTTEAEKDRFSQKNTYTAEEKKYIMQQLNLYRRIEQEEKLSQSQYTGYSSKEKRNILSEINDKRLEAQLYEEIKKRRIRHKKIYTFDVREFYKFLHMEREYFIETFDVQKISNRPAILTLYYRTFGEMKKKDFLIKTEVYSDKVYISSDVIRVYFKGYALENES